ncbi:MAG TPA: transglutaminaseTgpA domain-containing protein [Bryobacteraceae bacterium]|nr:transglutaminaseTgpA domain-containing protein [Bryobacteraceae bacterium]
MATPSTQEPQRLSDPPRTVERFFEFALLGMLASGYLAVATSGYLDWPTAIGAGIALCVRALMAAGVVRVAIPGRLADILAIIFLAFYPLDYLYLSRAFLPATIHLVFFLLICKVLTARTSRDFTLLKLLAAMELIAAAILSTSLGFFGFLALFLLFAVASFASGEVRASTLRQGEIVRGGLRAFPRRLGALSTFLFVGILAMTSVLFFVLPRTARAAIERFAPHRYHLPGFSNEVTLGQIGEIKRSSAAVMHIRLYTGEGPLNLRWRGAALSEFDGRRWFNPPGGDVDIRVPPDTHIVTFPVPRHPRRGERIVYHVQLSEIASDALFYAGTAQSISIDTPVLHFTRGGTLRVSGGSAAGMRYIASSWVEDEAATPRTPPDPLTPLERDELLLLPASLDSRISALARQIAGGMASDGEKATSIERYLRTHYGYTLQTPSAKTPDPLANFLFDRKKGHCEYFASSMAVMLRMVGVPSRVVTGFASGSFNPITGWQVVRASDAHSWVEAWVPGHGWTSYDPTPPDPGATRSAFLNRVSLFLDAADQFWQNWVMSYDLERQFVLASRVQKSGRGAKQRWTDRVAAWLAAAARSSPPWNNERAAALAILVFAAIFAALFGGNALKWLKRAIRLRRLKRGEGQASDATLLYQRMLGLLERRGIQKPPWLTPSEFARVLPTSELSPLVDDLTSAYVEFRFGGKPDAAPRMVQLLDQLEKM